MREQSIVQRMRQEAKQDRSSAPPFRFDIKNASKAVERIAVSVHAHEVEDHHDSSSFWFSLARDIRAGRYVTPEEVGKLVVKFPFLSRYSM